MNDTQETQFFANHELKSCNKPANFQCEQQEDSSSTCDTIVEEQYPVSKLNALIPAYVDNPCYLCHTLLSTPASLISHMKTIHNITLNPRANSRNRPRSTMYAFVAKKSQTHKRTLFGCPSCWFHCPQSFPRIGQHINDIHLDEEGEDFENPENEEEDIYYEDEGKGVGDDLSAKNYMISQLDELSAKFKTLFGF